MTHKFVGSIDVVSVDGSRRRTLDVYDPGMIQTLNGPAQIYPIFEFPDTEVIAHSRDGQTFTDPTDGVQYVRA